MLADYAAEDHGPPERLLPAYLKRWPPNSRSRQVALDRARTLWNAAGLPPWPPVIGAMRGNGKAAAQPADAVEWDCLVAFGLRPTELQSLELRQQARTMVALVKRKKEHGLPSLVTTRSPGQRLTQQVPRLRMPDELTT